MPHDPLAHVPGAYGLPGLGETLSFVADAHRFATVRRDRHGPVFKTRILGQDSIVFATPEAAKTVFLDRERVFSSELGWAYTIGELFARGLMLRDWDDHRVHRRVMQDAFRRDALAGYMALMHPVIEDHVAAWGERVDVYAAMKSLTLDIATRVFVGARMGEESEAVNRAFMAAVDAAVTPIRKDWPGLPYRRGMDGRRALQAHFAARVPDLRAAPVDGSLFSRLCHATGDDGRVLTDDEVVDHMIFLLLAAHDTTTATLAVMIWHLASERTWQERLRDEVAGLGVDALPFERASELVQTEWVFKEANRLVPPVPFSPRIAVGPTDVDGWHVPADAGVSVASLLIHRDPAWWAEPDVFDPERFSDERAEHRQHSHVYVPFAGGAHTCLGNHFAVLMAKAILTQVLQAHRFEASPGQTVDFRTVPIPRPRAPLVLNLSAA